MPGSARRRSWSSAAGAVVWETSPMYALLPMVLSSARRLAIRLISVVLPANDDESVAQVAPVARQQLKTVRTSTLTVDQVHTVTFGLDGTGYKIELSAGDAAELRADLATWVSHARRTSGSTATRGTRGSTREAATGAGHTTMIRSWARANGHHVSDRGRLPATVRQAYNAAH